MDRKTLYLGRKWNTRKDEADIPAAAATLELPFGGEEFNGFIWTLKGRPATRRSEVSAQHFSLGEMMWGKYYLEFLVFNLLPSLTTEDVDSVPAARG